MIAWRENLSKPGKPSRIVVHASAQTGPAKRQARPSGQLRPVDPRFRGTFSIFVAKAPGLVWPEKNQGAGKVVTRRPKNWPPDYHDHFHIVDPEWGDVTIRMNAHPPFGLQILRSGHEWIQRQAQKQPICRVKQDNAS